MALVKKSKIMPRGAAAPAGVAVAAAPRRAARAAPAGKQTVIERIAAATEELASGLTETSAATRELGQAMAQIASGAEEAAGASQEQSAAIKQIVTSLSAARSEADRASQRTEVVTNTLAEATRQIHSSVQAIDRAAQRQLSLVGIIDDLQARVKDIGEITQSVSRISDQTNLLALNAAIEAARAGEQGRGFAVVADEVRALAETSDKNARDVQRLAGSIEKDVRSVVATLNQAAATATKEGASAAAVAQSMLERRADMSKIADASRELLNAAGDAERAAVEAQKGAEQIASAAEEQSAGSAEAQGTI